MGIISGTGSGSGSGGGAKVPDPALKEAQQLYKLRTMSQMGNKKADVAYKNLLWSYGTQIGAEKLRKAGIPESEISKYSQPPEMSQNWQEKAAGGATAALSTLARPSQAILAAIQEINLEKDRALWGTDRPNPDDNPTVLGAALKGLKGKTDINFREAMLMDKDTGGVVGDVADIVGQAATDPLNLLGSGAGKYGKAALSTLGQDAATRGISQVIKRKGLSALSDAEQKLVETTLRTAFDEGATGAGKFLAKKGPEAAVARQMKELGRRGTGGVTVAGRTVKGTGGGQVGNLLRLTDITEFVPGQGAPQVQSALSDFTKARFGKKLVVPEEAAFDTIDLTSVPHAPADPAVAEAYKALAGEAMEQVNNLAEAGTKFATGPVQDAETLASALKTNKPVTIDTATVYGPDHPLSVPVGVNPLGIDEATPIGNVLDTLKRVTASAAGKEDEAGIFSVMAQMFSPNSRDALATEVLGVGPRNASLHHIPVFDNPEAVNQALTRIVKKATLKETKAVRAAKVSLVDTNKAVKAAKREVREAKQAVKSTKSALSQAISEVEAARRLVKAEENRLATAIDAKTIVDSPETRSAVIDARKALASAKYRTLRPAEKAADAAQEASSDAIFKLSKAERAKTRAEGAISLAKKQHDKALAAKSRAVKEAINTNAAPELIKKVETSERKARKALVESAPTIVSGTPDMTKVIREGLFTKAKGAPYIGPFTEWMSDTFRTMNRLASRTGEGARLKEEAKDALTKVAAKNEQRIEETTRRLNHLIKTGKLDADELATMYQASETVDGVKNLPPGTNPVIREQATEIRRMLNNLTGDLIESGAASTALVKQAETYMHRVLTEAGNKALAEVAEGGLDLGPVSLSGGGINKSRTLLPNEPLAVVEASPEAAKIRERARLAPDAQLYSQNPYVSVASYTGKASTVIAEAEGLTALSKILTDAGEQLLVTAPRLKKTATPAQKTAAKAAEARARRLGYVAVPISEATNLKAWAPADLLPEIQRMSSVVYHSESLKRLEKFIDDWNTLFKTSATVPITGGVGFQSRNLYGNIINNYLRGVVGIKPYKDAWNFAKKENEIQRIMEQTGKSWEAVAKTIDMGAEELAMLRRIREHGVLTSGFVQTDMAAGLLNPNKSGLKKAMDFLPITSTSYPARAGRVLNSLIEDNARIAHFVHKYNELGSASLAARSMRETLFDYSDLTQTEQRAFKRINVFYTWTRKNIPLQLKVLQENPGRINRVNNFRSELLGDENMDPSTSLSSWALRAGAVANTGALSSILGGGSRGLLIGLESPTDAAISTMLPFVNAVALLTPFESLQGEGGSYLNRVSNTAREIIQNNVGGPAEALRFMYELATQKDSFTGAPMKDIQGKALRDKPQLMADLISTVLPGISKTANLAEGLTSTGKYADDVTDSTRSILARAILGVQLTPQDETSDVNEKWAQYYDTQARLSELFPEGLPTLDELNAGRPTAKSGGLLS